MTPEASRPRFPLYLRLLLWFCIANVATLLVSVFATERIARGIYLGEPDWTELAQQASAAYLDAGRDGLRQWSERQRARGIDSRLYEDGRELLDRPPPPPVRPRLPALLDSEGIELRPEPELRIAGQPPKRPGSRYTIWCTGEAASTCAMKREISAATAAAWGGSVT